MRKSKSKEKTKSNNSRLGIAQNTDERMRDEEETQEGDQKGDQEEDQEGDQEGSRDQRRRSTRTRKKRTEKGPIEKGKLKGKSPTTFIFFLLHISAYGHRWGDCSAPLEESFNFLHNFS